MSQYNIIAESLEYTVVSEYEHSVSTSDAYQSEADLEKEFIHLLGEQGYEYLQIHKEADLISNLRAQLEKLNSYHFTDTEWEQFFGTCIANKNDDIVAKTAKIQEDYIQVLKRDTGESQNIYLIDKANIHNNYLQVINQYVEESGSYDTRYDVTILVNGLPLVHIELKRRGVQLKEAFNQINRYQRDSFWAGCGLYEYVQIFVISNGTNTKYYSNTTRSNHLKEQEIGGRNKSKKTSNSLVDAINDENVLPFRIDYVNTIKEKDGILDKQISAIDREKAMASPERVSQVVSYILEHFDQKTKRSSFYSFRVLDDIQKVASSKRGAETPEHKTEQKLNGFNAMFAVASIPMAKAYYNEFKKQQENLPEAQRLKIATIYSYGANEEEIDGILEEENPESTTQLDQQSRDFLEGAIKDYNQMFSTNYDTSSDRFQNYYKDLSLRMKNRHGQQART